MRGRAGRAVGGLPRRPDCYPLNVVTVENLPATPILDLNEEPPPLRRSRHLLAFAVGLAIGLGLGFGLDWLPPINGLAVLILLYPVIAIHEAGHLIAGKLVGMAPGGVLVGGFYFFRSGDRWTFHFEPRLIFGFLS